MAQDTILNNDVALLKSLSSRVATEILAKIGQGVIARPVRQEGVVALDPSFIWVIDSGSVALEALDKPVQTLTAGDVVGPWIVGLGPMRLVGLEQSSQVRAYERDKMEAILQKDEGLLKLWASFLSVAATSYFAAFAQLKVQSVPPLPQYRSFGRGDVILKEGDLSREVLSLVEGGAEVFVHGEKVGEIHRDELFGALAALTDSPRGATVVASKPSVCMVFVRDDFEDLLKSHSKMMKKLMEDIARAVGDLNEKVAKKEKSAPWLAL